MSIAIVALGYCASGASILAIALQFFHTIRSATTEGLSLGRCVFDALSLTMWAVYAAGVGDYPLLVAASCEAAMSVCFCLMIAVGAGGGGKAPKGKSAKSSESSPPKLHVSPLKEVAAHSPSSVVVIINHGKEAVLQTPPPLCAVSVRCCSTPARLLVGGRS